MLSECPDDFVQKNESLKMASFLEKLKLVPINTSVIFGHYKRKKRHY